MSRPSLPLSLFLSPSRAGTSSWRALLGAAVLSLAAPMPARADAAPPAAATSTRSAWPALRHQTCVPLSAADQARLPDAWRPYIAAARRCELTPPGGKPAARVALISVFALEYYAGKPDNAPWERFPRPLLVDREFRCLGGLPELFPYDQPATLQVRPGPWVDGVPREIRLHVKNPAVSGDYDLPTLRWDEARGRYQPVGGADPKEDPCPTS